MNDETTLTVNLIPYLALTRELAHLIVPVHPRPEFCAGLYAELLEQARRRPATALPTVEIEPVAGIPTRLARWIGSVPMQDRRWMWGAAAVSSAASLVGALAYLMHSRRLSVVASQSHHRSNSAVNSRTP